MNFKVAGGSVIGARHLSKGKNNQDSFHIQKNNDTIVAVVTDGCGSSKNSEVGAKIGAQNTVKIINSYLKQYVENRSAWKQDGAVWENINYDIVKNISNSVNQIKGGHVDVLMDYFLFTIIGFIITDDLTYIFNIGDGAWIENGNINKIGPFPGNAPPFIGYACLKNNFLFKESLSSYNTDFNVKIFNTENIESLLIGSDGILDFIDAEKKEVPGTKRAIGNISQFWQKKEYFEDEFAISEKLNKINCINSKNSGLLQDDTTLIVARREE